MLIRLTEDVYFRAAKFEEYGKLSHMPLEDLEAGARIDVSEQKGKSDGFCTLEKCETG